MKFKVFTKSFDTTLMDRETFSFSHNLKDHPSLKLENILKIIPTLPKEKVMYSKSIEHIGENLGYALENHKRELDIDEVVKNLKDGNSFIALRNPELHPTFKEIFGDIIHDISLVLQSNKKGKTPIDPNIWLFVASPNAFTPYHFDRSSNFIFQIRGSKELAVFPPRDEKVMKKSDYEAFMDWNGECPKWSEEIDQYAHKHDFKAGDAAHIPFISGHYVKNGADDISITISIFFQSDETAMWSNAMRMNNRLRKLGLKTRAVNERPFIDQMKSRMFRKISYK